MEQYRACEWTTDIYWFEYRLLKKLNSESEMLNKGKEDQTVSCKWARDIVCDQESEFDRTSSMYSVARG